MPSLCLAPGCSKPARGYSRHCSRHRNQLRANGHPQQSAIRADELKSYEKAIEGYRQKHPSIPFWSALENAWRTFAVDCGSATPTLTGSLSNRHRWSREAREVVSNIHLRVDPWVVCRTALAVYMLQHFDPRRFHSDEAFNRQLVRCLRRLAPNSYRKTRSRRTGNISTHLDVLHAQTAILLGQWMTDLFGAAGLMFARWVENQANRQAAKKDAFRDAIMSLPDPAPDDDTAATPSQRLPQEEPEGAI
jgi:hypothetical protein